MAVKLLFSWDAQLDILWAGDALQSRYCTLSDQKTGFRRQASEDSQAQEAASIEYETAEMQLADPLMDLI